MITRRPNGLSLSCERRGQWSLHYDCPGARRLQPVRRRAANSRRPTSACDGAEYHACPSAEPERARNYRNSRTRCGPQEDSRRSGTAGSGGDGAYCTPKRHARRTWCAVPGYHARDHHASGSFQNTRSLDQSVPAAALIGQNNVEGVGLRLDVPQQPRRIRAGHAAIPAASARM